MKIQIKHCNAQGKAFANCIDYSIHETIKTPQEHRKSKLKGIWIQGIGEPVKLLPNEYIVID